MDREEIEELAIDLIPMGEEKMQVKLL